MQRPTPEQIVATILIHPDPVGYVVALAKQVTPESVKAAYSAERGAERDAAWDAASDAAWDAASDAARNAERDAVWDAASDAVWGAASDTAHDAAREAPRDAERIIARNAAWDAAYEAAVLAGACVVKDLITHEQLLTLAEALHRHLPETFDTVSIVHN